MALIATENLTLSVTTPSVTTISIVKTPILGVTKINGNNVLITSLLIVLNASLAGCTGSGTGTITASSHVYKDLGQDVLVYGDNVNITVSGPGPCSFVANVAITNAGQTFVDTI